MNKKIFLIATLFILMSGVLSGCTSSNKSKALYFDEDGNPSTTKPEVKVAEKLEVYNFYSTQRCVACETLGQMSKDLITEKYSQEIKEGKIDYRQINVDLPENKEVARKYQASGSALFINRIIDGQDNIQQDITVWRLLSSKAQFDKYLGDKIDSYLGL